MGSRGKYQEVSAQPPSVPRGKVLLVDEHPEDLQLYFNILDAYGYRVRACNSYQEGVRSLGDELTEGICAMTSAPIFTEDDRRCALEIETLIDERFGNDARGAQRP
jgi:hypothetical protein